MAEQNFQRRFEQRWGHLTEPRVRALAWLLDSPDLLDASSAAWHGRIASLGPLTPDVAAWLASLQQDPSALDADFGGKIYSRLGLYAEKLLAFYFKQHGQLFAHGLQVRASRNDTVGEFDFLLRQGDRLLHWELATKFYLLDGAPDAALNHLIGPNLADALGLKMRKIFDKQLALASHPAAQPLLPQPVSAAQALVKGWLFYPQGVVQAMTGIAPDHGCGFWCTTGELPERSYVLLPRLQWLAPYKGRDEQVLAAGELAIPLAQPYMVAEVETVDGWQVEVARGFVVPDDWAKRAGERRQAGMLPA